MTKLQVLKMILSRHKENLSFYKRTNNQLGINHCNQMIFDWTVIIHVVELFEEK